MSTGHIPFALEQALQKLIVATLLIAAVIHLLPLSGVVGIERLTVLYGLRLDDPNLEILMRHRAVLFGLLGLLLVLAAFRPALRPLAFAGGFGSVVSFLVLAYAVGGYNAEVSRVVAADWLALAALLVGAWATWAAGRPRAR